MKDLAVVCSCTFLAMGPELLYKPSGQAVSFTRNLLSLVPKHVWYSLNHRGKVQILNEFWASPEVKYGHVAQYLNRWVTRSESLCISCLKFEFRVFQSVYPVWSLCVSVSNVCANARLPKGDVFTESISWCLQWRLDRKDMVTAEWSSSTFNRRRCNYKKLSDSFWRKRYFALPVPNRIGFYKAMLIKTSAEIDEKPQKCRK